MRRGRTGGRGGGLATLALLLSVTVASCASPDAVRTAHDAGARTTKGEVTVLGLGDSVMAGTACGCAGPVAGYARAMHDRTGTRIVDVNLGSNGATTSSLLEDLGEPAVRQRVAAARVVLVIIGANDLLPQLARWTDQGCPRSCYLPAVHTMGRRLGQVLGEITGVRHGRTADVLVADYWNVFTDGQVARDTGGQQQITWSRAVSRAANRAICGASRQEHTTCADTYTPFVGGGADPTRLLADDGDHPNAEGVDVLVKQLVAVTPRGTF